MMLHYGFDFIYLPNVLGHWKGPLFAALLKNSKAEIFFLRFFEKVRILIHTLRFLIVFARPRENGMLTGNATIIYAHLLVSNVVTKMDTCG